MTLAHLLPPLVVLAAIATGAAQEPGGGGRGGTPEQQPPGAEPGQEPDDASGAGTDDESVEQPPPTDPRSTGEILSEIMLKRDAADLELFEVLGARRDAAALSALEQLAVAMYSPQGMESAFEAFRWFVGQGALATRALGFLTTEAQNGYPYKMRAAVRALRAYGDAALEPLRAVLDEHRDRVCKEIAIGGLVTALRTEGTKEALELLLAFYRPPQSGSYDIGARTLRAFTDEDSVRLMTRTLRDKRVPSDLHAMIVEALGGMAAEGIDEELVDLLRSKSPDVVLAAISALTERGYSAHARALERLERSRDPAVRRAALVAQAAFRANDAEWTERVLEAAAHRDWALRMGACAALASLRDPAALEALHARLADEHHLVRAEAIAAAERARHKASIPLLIERMDAETMRLRHRLHRALVVLTGKDLGPTAVRWRAWWEAEGENFAVPRAAETAKLAAARARRRADNATQAAFYGIRIASDRVCFVLDVSGSMDYPVGPAGAVGLVGTGGESRLEAVQRELLATLESLPDGARFNLVFFASRAERWQKRLVEMDSKSRRAAERHVRQQMANGGTALFEGLVRAFDDEEVDTIFVLSDGQPTEGRIVDPDAILREVRDMNRLRGVVIHCIAVDWTGDLLESLAEETGGDYITVR